MNFLRLIFRVSILMNVFCVLNGAAQTISSFSPTFGTNGQGFIVITGTGFSNSGLVVKFNNTTASASASSATQISAIVPAGATTGPISVKVGAGSTITSADDFIVISQAPYITNFPSTAAMGTMITIQGVQFTGATAVKFNGTNASFTPPSSDGQIQATVPANVTTGPISITTSKGTGTSSSNFFVAPTITSFSPINGRSGTNVIITGKNFTGTTVVKLNAVSVPSFTVDSNTQITMTVPVNGTTGPLSVTAPASQFITSSNFVVRPSIFSFSPYFGKSGTNVTIVGANLIGATNVYFNGVAATPTGVTSNQLTAAVPGAATSGPITVATTNGIAVSSTNFFLPPNITVFTPTNGAPGTNVTISGVNFTNATSVTFNGVSANFGVVNNGSITSTVPVGASSGPISVTAPGGTATTIANFFVRPIVSGFTPSSGVAGTSVTISGSSFTNASAVLFNGLNSTNFTVQDNFQITAGVPAGATTGPISVIAPGGTGVSAENFVIDVFSLSIKLLTNNVVSISWPTNATGFVLQAITNLNSATNSTNWAQVTNVPFVQNGKSTVTNSATNNATFYRLKK